MPKKPYKVCWKAGCHRLTQVTYCAKHKLTGEELKAHREKYRRRVGQIKARANSGERGYNSVWRKHRKAFLNSNPWCKHCFDKSNLLVVANVVDHIIPHKGDNDLFWGRANWQPLCYSCHSKKTVTEDGGFGRPTKRPEN
jgi:5-methylcytosine-specific restriction protein A